MADPLYELLSPEVESHRVISAPERGAISSYLNRLSTLSVSSLTSTEPESHAHDAQSLLKSLQALSKRSYRSINNSLTSLSHLREYIPELHANADVLQAAVPTLETDASTFSQKYCRSSENEVLNRRRSALRLVENVERLSDILELPTLLSSIIAASASTSVTSSTGSTSSVNANYASALDLYAHIKRLQRLYPKSDIVTSISSQAEDAMRGMTTNLISSLGSQSLKMAGAMRLIGLLRRVAPELDDHSIVSKDWTSGTDEGSLGALFLVCRLANLMSTLEALDPLRELADQESAERLDGEGHVNDRSVWAGGQQTERYLKRYIEIFREQCFAIISMYKSIFPTSLQGPGASLPQQDLGTEHELYIKHSTKHAQNSDDTTVRDPLQQLPSALSTFTFHLVETLTETLKNYLPNLRDQASRESLLIQVLYCSSSLGRLGGDFGLMLSTLEEGEDGQMARDPEWVEVMKKHRVQSSRLELLASGAGSTRSTGIPSTAITSAG